ncbi:MAG TPA: hypothetical protein VKA46_15210 [Gemmataceae bacterium]|nr:hypothetical protein [Gemmataceae bacterium]
MALSTVPDYFQEETEAALREQVAWLVREIGVDDVFFSRLLRTDAAAFGDWRAARAPLSPEDQQTLHSLWHTMLHLLSHFGCEEARVRDLFHYFLPAPRRSERSPVAPPWSGSTLRSFLETGGAEAIDRVDWWVTGLRFGNPYAG